MDISPVISEDGVDLITERSEILQRWAEHYRTLLNCQRDVDTEVKQDFPCLETVHELDQPPTEREVRDALDSLKPGKSLGPDCIPGEVLRLGVYTVTKCMFNFITAVWSAERVPQQWKDANIISIYKREGDQAICGNSRGISLLSTVARSWQR